MCQTLCQVLQGHPHTQWVLLRNGGCIARVDVGSGGGKEYYVLCHNVSLDLGRSRTVRFVHPHGELGFRD